MVSLRRFRQAKSTTLLARVSALALVVMGLLPPAAALSMNDVDQLPGTAVHRTSPTAPPWRRATVTDGVGLLAAPVAMREEHLKKQLLSGSARADRAIDGLNPQSGRLRQLVDHGVAANLRPATILRL